jgi:hypothetical protein
MTLAQPLDQLGNRQDGGLVLSQDWNDLVAGVQSGDAALGQRVDAIVQSTATVHASPGDDLAAAIAALPEAGGELALGAGRHELAQPLTVRGRKRLAITGAGPATVLAAPASETALVFEDCADVRVARVRVEGGAPPAGTPAAQIGGALTFAGTTEVVVSECTLACPAGPVRTQACLLVRASAQARPGRVRVERGRLEVGAGQTGMLLLDVADAVVVDNHVFTAGGPDPVGQGIVVGGTAVGTVRILHNLVEDAIQGIHVGVSQAAPPPGRGLGRFRLEPGLRPFPGRRPSPGRERFAARAVERPRLVADAVVLAGNVVHAFVPAGYKRDRHAVFVGNARSVSITQTTATLRRTTPAAEEVITPVEGIRVYGALGRFVVIRDSSLRDFSVGVRVVPLDAPAVATWLVADTLADGAAAGADVPDTVEQERNRPATTIRRAGPPARVTLVPAVAASSAGTPHRVTATVVDLAGVRVQGASVRFSVTGVNPLPESAATTDDKGEATFEYTGANAGTDSVLVYVDKNRNGTREVDDPFASATQSYVARDPAFLEFAAPVLAGTRGQPVTVAVRVRDAAANVVAGIEVRFFVQGANFVDETPVVTDAAGVASFAYTGAQLGTDTVTAFAVTSAGERRTATASVTFLPPDPARVVLTPPAQHASRGDGVEVVATVFDPAGAPLGGVPIRFAVTGANRADAEVVSDPQGQARFGYRGSNEGQDAVTAFADVNRSGQQEMGEPFATAAVTFVARPVGRVIVPDLGGLPRQALAPALARANLTLGRVTLRRFAGRPGGLPLVISQSPDAGALVTPGSAVDVVLMAEPIEDFPGRPRPGRPPFERPGGGGVIP